MPLPPALLARLKQRGIVSEKPDEVHEEVIAEDYDSDDSDQSGEEEDNAERIQAERKAVQLPDDEIVPGCPNKNNIYHNCTVYCREQWGQGKQVPSPRTERRYQKLLRRYPLPDDWEEVWEPGLGCFYFWNIENDEVSWLPPGHPKAKVTVSAAKLKHLMKEQNLDADSDSNESQGSSDESESESDSDSSASEPSADKNSKRPRIEERVQERRRPPFNNRNSGNRGRPRRNEFDPMDPASYSDCPRGKWSDGLGKEKQDD